ncbi:MAG: hypothetical protein IT374_11075 [Polyangiaceae bacterium]|nr:hypothetical protein [Polyangiaceae bacterium]
MTLSRGYALLGAGLAAAGLALAMGGVALAPAVDRAVLGEDLRVMVRSPTPYLRQSVGHASPAPLLLPGELRWRVEETRDVEAGVELLGWRASYAHRWEREVWLPALGPLEPAGDSNCGYTLSFRPEVLDTSSSPWLERELTRRGQRGIDAANQKLARMQRENFVEWTSFRFPKVASATLRTKASPGRLDTHVELGFGRGWTLSFDAALSLDADGGRLRVRSLTAPSVRASPGLEAAIVERVHADHGPLCLLGRLPSLLGRPDACASIVGSTLQSEGERAILGALEALDAALSVTDFASPVPGRRDRFAVRVPSAPTVDAGGVTLPFCLAAHLAPPLRDPVVEGYPVVASVASPAPATRAPGGSGPRITVSLTPAAVNQLLYVAWQSGALGALGRSSVVLDALPREARDLAFTVTGLDPRLAPYLSSFTRDGATVSALSVKLGDWGAREVVGHARLALELGASGPARAKATLTPRLIGVDCEARRGSDWELTPCLSDLLPAVRQRVIGRRMVGELDLEQALGLATAGLGLRPSLRGLELELSPAGLSLGAELRLHAP